MQNTGNRHILLIIRQLTNIQKKNCTLNRRIRSRAQVEGEVEDLEKTNLSVGIDLGLNTVR